MKYSCEVIKDLLPLYIDDYCSQTSRHMVEEHLEECPSCKKEWQTATGEVFPAVEVEKEERSESISAHTMKRGLKKITRAWVASLLAVILLIPTSILAWNQVQGTGICFTNLKERWIAHVFMDALSERDYEAAFRQISIETVRNDFQSEWFDEEDMVNFEADAKSVFRDCCQALNDAGGITDYKFVSICDVGEVYEMKYLVTLGQRTCELTLHMEQQGVISLNGGNGNLMEPSPLATFGLWKEYLWEQYALRYLETDEQGNVFTKSGTAVPFREYWRYAPVEFDWSDDFE